MTLLVPRNQIIVDNFAGGGGASKGIEAAIGRPVDYAINHDREAIAMHRANHPHTHHFCDSVWDVDPRAIARGRTIAGGWFSPDCTFHSKARGAKPFRERHPARRRRGLAGIVPRWLSATGMVRFWLENVEEFADWGPLLEDGRPCPKRRGLLFRRWHRQIENIVSRETGLPYRIDMRELRASDYGAPTTRKRLFVIGRCDGEEIVFPDATHGPGLLPYRTAAECIDWSIPCPSIFTRERPLADATLRRIARGVMRYVVHNPRPFIAPSVSESVLVAPSIINTRNGERAGQSPRVRDIEQPFPTVTAVGSQGALACAFLAAASGPSYAQKARPVNAPLHTVTSDSRAGVVTAFIAKHYGGNYTGPGIGMDSPLDTITTVDHHALVRAFLIKYYGTDQDPRIDAPLGTITTKDRFGLVTIHGEPYRIVDIGMRMLAPRELFNAQSFAPDYIIDHGIDEFGTRVPLTKTAQVRMCGNSVAPAVAEAIVRANLKTDEVQRKAA